MKVWRVFNGSIGFCGIHRIVVAETKDDAVEVAKAHGMIARHEFEVEYVCDAELWAAESEDWGG